MRKTVPEYAQYAQISVATVYRHINSGKLDSDKIGGVTYVILDENQAEKITELDENQRIADENQRLADENRWLREQIDRLHAQIQSKDNHLEEKDTQIRELHQLLGMAQKNQQSLTERLTETQKQLENHTKRRWWKWWG